MQRIKGFFNAQRVSEEGKAAVRLEMWLVGIALFLIIVIIANIIIATTAFGYFPPTGYFAFWGIILFVLGFYGAYKLHSIIIFIYLALAVLTAISNIITAIWLFTLARFWGGVVVSAIFAIVYAGLLGWTCWLSFGLFRMLGGFSSHDKSSTPPDAEHF